MISKILQFLAKIKNILVIAIAIVALIFMFRACNLSKQYEDAITNEKALIAKINKNENDIRVYKFTIDQMRMIQDSAFQRMTYVIDSLKIKNKNLQQAQHHHIVIYKTDTLTLKDTIYKDPNFCLDTLLGDKWVQTEVHLHYPSTIAVSPKVTSEKVCIISLKKETVKPPKKTWIGRLFQKKHKVAKVDIIESNPYVIKKEDTFIEIVK